jgi:hypothetical protein
MSDRRTYQREVAELLQQIDAETRRLYRLEAAGGRRPDSADLDEARRRLARLIEAA